MQITQVQIAALGKVHLHLAHGEARKKGQVKMTFSECPHGQRLHSINGNISSAKA